MDRNPLAALVPGVADGEEDAGVVAGIVVTEAGVRMVNDIDAEVDGAIGPDKIMDAAADLRREIDARGVRRRHVGGGEENAAGDVEVGNDAMVGGEIPAEDEGFDAGAVDRTLGSEDGVDGHDFEGVFEIAADWSAAKEIGREDESGAATGKEELSVRGFAGAGAAAEECAEVPGALAVGEGVG